MGIVQVHLPDHIQSVIDRQIAEGRAASEADYIVEALRLYADHLEAEDDIDRILLHSAREWGLEAASRYDRLMRAAFAVVAASPLLPGSQDVPRIPGVR